MIPEDQIREMKGRVRISTVVGEHVRLKKAGANMKVVKNRLAKIAISGKPATKIADLFKGPTAIAFSEDPVAAAKVVDAYAKKNDRLVVLGGAMGDEVMNADAVKALAAMPSREELLGQIVQTIMSPGADLIGAVAARFPDRGHVVTLAVIEGDAAFRGIGDMPDFRGIGNAFAGALQNAEDRRLSRFRAAPVIAKRHLRVADDAGERDKLPLRLLRAAAKRIRIDLPRRTEIAGLTRLERDGGESFQNHTRTLPKVFRELQPLALIV